MFGVDRGTVFLVPQHADVFYLGCVETDTTRWLVWRHLTLGSQQRKLSQGHPTEETGWPSMLTIRIDKSYAGLFCILDTLVRTQ